LTPGESIVFPMSFKAGDSKRYKMFLKATRDDGLKIDEIRIYEPVEYATETRRRIGLRNNKWAVQMRGKKDDRADMAGDWKNVLNKADVNFQVKLKYKIGRMLDKPIEPENKYWGFIRTAFKKPMLQDGERLLVSFPIAYNHPALFVNGGLVAQTVSAIPLVADITSALKTPDEQQLVLRLGTARSIYADEGEGADFRRKLLYPYMGNRAGVYAGPWLEVVPEIRIERALIDTSVRKGEITVTYVLRNDTRRSRVVVLEGAVYGRGKPALEFEPVSVLVYAEQSMRVKVKTRWENPVLWQVRKPYLYRLTTQLLPGSKKIIGAVKGAKPLDVHHERFGFREVWTEGRNYLINGQIAHFKSQLSSPHPRYTGVPFNFENHYRQFQVATRAGIYFTNNHSHYLSLYENEIADELGLLQRPKLSLNMAYADWRRSFDDSPRFWKAHEDYARARVESLYNHPSLGWITIENETFLCGAGDHFPNIFAGYRGIVEAIKGVKQGLLVDFDGSDPAGIADLWNMHYPMKYQRWMPLRKRWNPPVFQDGQWMPFQLFPGAGLANGTKPFLFGEDFIGYPETPGSLSFLSDEEIYEAFRIKRTWFGNVKALARGYDRLHTPFIRSFRGAGATVITTWPQIGDAFFTELDAEIVYVEEPWRNVVSREKFAVTVRLHHDLFENLAGNLAWEYMDKSGKVFSKGAQRFILTPGDMHRHKINLENPEVTEIRRLKLVIKLTAEERLLAQRTERFIVFPKVELPQVRIQLHDPSLKLASKLLKRGVACRAGRTPQKGELFIIGEDALTKLLPKDREKIVRFAHDGGRLLVMAQGARIPEWLELRLVPQVGVSSWAAFPRAKDHPVLKGMQTDYFRFWRAGGQQVSAADYWKPGSSNLISLLDTGNVGGFLTTALAELPFGGGSILFTQLKITDNLDKDPAALMLMANILEYTKMKSYRGKLLPVEVVTDRNSYAAQALYEAGVETGSHSNILFADGSLKDADGASVAIERVRRGATLWLHGMTPDSAVTWEKAALAGLKLEPEARVRVVKVAQNALMAGLSNTDMHWVGMKLAPMPGGYEQKGIANVVEYKMELPGCVNLVDGGALAVFPLGEGKIVIDNLRWSAHLNALPTKARRIASLLATNMGASVTPVGPDKSYRPVAIEKRSLVPIKLAAAANVPLNGTLKGIKYFGGIRFDLKTNDTGAVIVGSSILTSRMQNLKNISAKIPVGTTGGKANAIYFLMTAFDPYEGGRGYGSGEIIGGVDMEYADGTRERLVLRHKVHVLNLFESMGDLREGKLVWEGDSPFAVWLDKWTRWEGNRWPQREHPNRLYLVRWVNPRPDGAIRNLRLFGANKHVLPIILGVTVETRK